VFTCTFDDCVGCADVDATAKLNRLLQYLRIKSLLERYCPSSPVSLRYFNRRVVYNRGHTVSKERRYNVLIHDGGFHEQFHGGSFQFTRRRGLIPFESLTRK